MLGLSSGLIYNNPIVGSEVFTYASNWWQFDSEYALYAQQGWRFDPCGQPNTSILINPTGGSRSNDNHVSIFYLGSQPLSDNCMTWNGYLISAGDLGGGLKDGDVVTFSYEMGIGPANDRWDPGDGSAVPILTTISGFDAVSTNFTPFIVYPVYTEVSIEVTKSGGAQDEGLNITIGPFDKALTNAAVYFKRVNATVTRPG